MMAERKPKPLHADHPRLLPADLAPATRRMDRGREIVRRVNVISPGFRPVVGAEIGVLKGRLSRYLLRNLPRLELWMVDGWREPEGDPAGRPRGDDLAKAVLTTEFAAGRRRIVMEHSPAAAARVPDGLDFVFIDAGHQYGQVFRDLRAWYPKVRPGGLVSGHDIDLYPPGRKWAVRHAVEILMGIERIDPAELEVVHSDVSWFFIKPLRSPQKASDVSGGQSDPRTPASRPKDSGKALTSGTAAQGQGGDA